MEEIDLKELFNFFRKKIGLLIIITMSICLIGCVYGIFIQKPLYKSETTVVLGSSSSNNSESITQNDININRNLVDTYAEIVRSKRVLNQVIASLDIDITYNELTKMISVGALNNTEIIKISVSDVNNVRARNIADETAKFFAKEVSKLYKIDNVNVLDEAEISKEAYNINVPKQIIIYFMIGLVIGCGVLFIIFYFDRSVKSVQQVEDKLKLPILGSISEFSVGGKK